MFPEICGRRIPEGKIFKGEGFLFPSRIFTGRHPRWTLYFWLFMLLIFCGPEASSQEEREEPANPSPPGQQEKHSQPAAVGVLEIPRPDGGKDKIYYAIITPQEESQRRKEEMEKSDRSWEMLKNVIIDKRTR